MEDNEKINYNLDLEINGIYRTHIGDLVKIISIDESNDRIKIFNISDGANQWVSLSRSKQFKFKSRIK